MTLDPGLVEDAAADSKWPGNPWALYVIACTAAEDRKAKFIGEFSIVDGRRIDEIGLRSFRECFQFFQVGLVGNARKNAVNREGKWRTICWTAFESVGSHFDLIALLVQPMAELEGMCLHSAKRGWKFCQYQEQTLGHSYG